MDRRTKEVIEGTLTADAYCLGTHWISDPLALSTLDVDWNAFNAPHSIYHANKSAGQFTHYGDQLVTFYRFALSHHRFNLTAYMKDWYYLMKHYDGYMDPASRYTLDNIRSYAPLPCGFGSEDLSVVGRMAPLLALSDDKDTFLQNVDLFTRATHYTEIARASAQFVGELLWLITHGEPFQIALLTVVPKSPERIQHMVSAARVTEEENTVDVIRWFGTERNANKALPGALHLLFKYDDDYRHAMIQNAKAGGDSSARAMVAGMLMVAQHGIKIVPNEWRTKLSVQPTHDPGIPTQMAG